jgi:hypothetical protein
MTKSESDWAHSESSNVSPFLFICHQNVTFFQAFTPTVNKSTNISFNFSDLLPLIPSVNSALFVPADVSGFHTTLSTLYSLIPSANFGMLQEDLLIMHMLNDVGILSLESDFSDLPTSTHAC